MIRPLPALKEPEHKSNFVLGEDATQENADVPEPAISVPAEPRPVEECLSILKNPDVRALLNIPAILLLLLFFFPTPRLTLGSLWG